MTTTANQPKELWEAVLGDLQMHVTRPNFETWLKNTVGIAFRDGEFVVGAPNAFVAEMLETDVSEGEPLIFYERALGTFTR